MTNVEKVTHILKRAGCYMTAAEIATTPVHWGSNPTLSKKQVTSAIERLNELDLIDTVQVLGAGQGSRSRRCNAYMLMEVEE